jgi:hypothetical protein
MHLEFRIIQLQKQAENLTTFIFNCILINIHTWKVEPCPSQKIPSISNLMGQKVFSVTASLFYL